MRIPNKFNGYSADNRRIYNDPATVVATIGSMSEAATVAETMAALTAAAAPVAETALTAAAVPTAMEMAGQGIMQGVGAGAQMASPLEAAGSTAMNTAGASPLTTAGGSVPTTAGADLTTTAGGINPAGQNQVIDAFTQAQANPINSPELGKYAGDVTQLPPSPRPGLDAALTPQGSYSGPTADVDIANKVAKQAGIVEKTGNGLLDGFNAAKNFVTEKASDAYKAFREAPPALQYASTALTAKKYLFEQPKQEGPKKYKPIPYSGLSPDFQPGGPSKYLYGFADGGITGGPVEQMSNMNAIGGNEMYPMANIPRLEYANPVQQRPVAENIMTMGGDAPTDPYTGELKFSTGGSTDDDEDKTDAEQRKYYAQLMSPQYQTKEVSHHTEGFGIVPRSRAQSLGSPNTAAQAEMAAMMKKYKIKSALPKALDPQGSGIEEAASGGIMHGLGGYSDGGRLLKGPGDGVSDSIPAVIGSRQPARLADGEFVIPARIVSELGNGSTEAGARQLYAMMDRIQNGRKKSVGKGKVAVDSKAKKHLPA